MKKRNLLKIIVITLILTISIIIILTLLQNAKEIGVLEKTKNIISKQNENDNKSITTVDVTNLEDGTSIEHEHLFKTNYNNSTHWQECTICEQRQNEKAHTYTSSWTLGTANDCNPNNIQKKVCTCGYSYETTEGRKAHTLKYHNNTGVYCGMLQCSTCWSGMSIQNQHECYKANGTRINCSNLGTCNICNYTYTTSNSQHGQYYWGRDENEDKNLYCMSCNTTYLARLDKYELVKQSENVYKLYADITVPSNAQYISNRAFHYWGNNVTMQNSLTRNGTKWSNVATITFNGHNETKSYGAISNDFYLNGVRCNVVITATFGIDKEPPVISNINMGTSEELTEWSKTKPITISGTENYCNTVTVKIIDEKGETIFNGGGNVSNKNYQVQCIPEIECDTKGRVFKAIVTDNLENSSEKEFIISKVDAIPPTPTSGTEILGDWAREKEFTFTATDYGIGQVQVAFNDIEDLQLATEDGKTFSRDYKFIGDVYTPKELSVMYKDGLGNTSMQKITIDKLDNTAPSITNTSIHNDIITIEAHDRHETLGEGSGVVKYRYLASEEKLTNPELTEENSIEIENKEIKIKDIYKVKYIYVIAEDYVGNISKVYEFKVPELILTSSVNLNTEDRKGEIILDWSSYDISDKYFVVYRKKDRQTEWEEIVPLTEKLTGNTYTDKLGNDESKPNTPIINITGDAENNNINITVNTTDNGSTYIYYIEAYDQNLQIISKSEPK